MATYGDYASLTRATRAPAPAAVASLTGREASPRFNVGGHSAAACSVTVSSRPTAYLPTYAGMAMTPSDIMRQQICYQGIYGRSHGRSVSLTCTNSLLWPPYVYGIGQAIIFSCCGFYLLSSSSVFFSWPNLSSRRLDVYHTSTHGVALVRI